MAIKRITISVPDTVARQLKKAAGGAPVSALVTELIETHLDDAALERQWDAFCRDVQPTRAEGRRADAIFKRLTRARRKTSAA